MAMKQSWFSYNITRQYPFRWFDYITIIGGLLATALFSVLNVVSTGYEMKTIYATNPNQTVNTQTWFDSLPDTLTGKTKPVCQDEIFQINSQLFTNNSGLFYTITDILNHETPNKDNTTTTPPQLFSALTYHNNILEDCIISEIQVDWDRSKTNAFQYASGSQGFVGRAQGSCSLSSDISFNFTVEYDYLPVGFSNRLNKFFVNGTGYPRGKYFIEDDPLKSASLWWGQSLLAYYWLAMSNGLSNEDTSDNDAYIVDGLKSGTYIFDIPQDLASQSQIDAYNETLFGFSFLFVSSDGNVFFNGGSSAGGSYPLTLTAILEATTQYSPNIWRDVDFFAKSLYFSVMADLGQISPSNLLLNETALRNFTAAFTSDPISPGGTYFGPATMNYDILQNSTGPLEIRPAVFVAQYICQVPQLKSPLSLIISVALANLVFLSACWTVLAFIATKVVEKRDPNAMACVMHLAEAPMPADGEFEHRDYYELVTSGSNSESLPLSNERQDLLVTRHQGR